MPLPTLTSQTVDRARDIVAAYVPPTPAYRWPLLDEAVGTALWVKHENHTPTGAFKVRGGLTFMHHLAEQGTTNGVISASRGNHSQSLAFAGARFKTPVTIVVPEGNSPDKNAATRAFGARLIVHGRDFQEALDHAHSMADLEGLTPVPPLHAWLVEGVATYAVELHESVPGLDRIYVPIGMGSGVCANIAVRDMIGASTEIVGVVSSGAPAYAHSYAAGTPVATESADTFVDGVACRIPDPDAVETIRAGAARVAQVSDEQTAQAMTLMYRATHNLAEPAGAIALAAALAERDTLHDKRVAIVQTGGNADFDVLARAFAGPRAGA